MTKFAVPGLIVVILIGVIVTAFISLGNIQQMVVVEAGNTDYRPLEMTAGHFQDSECGMVIDDLEFASQVVAPDGKTWFFHDHGGMAAWLKTKPFQQNAVIWVHARDTGTWINGHTAWYSRTDETPMLYGFGAYQSWQNGFIDFNQMQGYMLRGETIANPAIRKQLLGQ